MNALSFAFCKSISSLKDSGINLSQRAFNAKSASVNFNGSPLFGEAFYPGPAGFGFSPSA